MTEVQATESHVGIHPGTHDMNFAGTKPIHLLCGDGRNITILTTAGVLLYCIGLGVHRDHCHGKTRAERGREEERRKGEGGFLPVVPDDSQRWDEYKSCDCAHVVVFLPV